MVVIGFQGQPRFCQLDLWVTLIVLCGCCLSKLGFSFGVRCTFTCFSHALTLSTGLAFPSLYFCGFFRLGISVALPFACLLQN